MSFVQLATVIGIEPLMSFLHSEPRGFGCPEVTCFQTGPNVEQRVYALKLQHACVCLKECEKRQCAFVSRKNGKSEKRKLLIQEETGK